MSDKKNAIVGPLVFIAAITIAVPVARFFDAALTDARRTVVIPDSLKIGPGQGSGSSGTDTSKRTNSGFPYDHTEPIKFLSKPEAQYTELARENDVQGTVRLEVVLLASGTVGGIKPVTTLPYGLTEQAIQAARKIKFIPKVLQGRPSSVIVTIDYDFHIY